MEWINIKDRLPDDTRNIIVKLNSGVITGGFCDNNGKWYPIGVETFDYGYSGCGFNDDINSWSEPPK